MMLQTKENQFAVNNTIQLNAFLGSSKNTGGNKGGSLFGNSEKSSNGLFGAMASINDIKNRALAGFVPNTGCNPGTIYAFKNRNEFKSRNLAYAGGSQMSRH